MGTARRSSAAATTSASSPAPSPPSTIADAPVRPAEGSGVPSRGTVANTRSPAAFDARTASSAEAVRGDRHSKCASHRPAQGFPPECVRRSGRRHHAGAPACLSSPDDRPDIPRILHAHHDDDELRWIGEDPIDRGRPASGNRDDSSRLTNGADRGQHRRRHGHRLHTRCCCAPHDAVQLGIRRTVSERDHFETHAGVQRFGDEVRTVDQHQIVILGRARHVTKSLDERILPARDAIHGLIVPSGAQSAFLGARGAPPRRVKRVGVRPHAPK